MFPIAVTDIMILFFKTSVSRQRNGCQRDIFMHALFLFAPIVLSSLTSSPTNRPSCLHVIHIPLPQLALLPQLHCKTSSLLIPALSFSFCMPSLAPPLSLTHTLARTHSRVQLKSRHSMRENMHLLSVAYDLQFHSFPSNVEFHSSKLNNGSKDALKPPIIIWLDI